MLSKKPKADDPDSNPAGDNRAIVGDASSSETENYIDMSGGSKVDDGDSQDEYMQLDPTNNGHDDPEEEYEPFQATRVPAEVDEQDVYENYGPPHAQINTGYTDDEPQSAYANYQTGANGGTPIKEEPQDDFGSIVCEPGLVDDEPQENYENIQLQIKDTGVDDSDYMNVKSFRKHKE